MAQEDTRQALADLWLAPTVYRSDLFAGQVVLVPGGAGGIGRAVTLLFARLGASVLITGRKTDKLETVAAFANEHGGDVQIQNADMREPEQVEAIYRAIGERWGRLDHLVNCAGGQFPGHAIDYSAKGWQAVVANNLHGSWFLMQAAAQFWREREAPGSIVNVVAVTERGMPGVAHSIAARAGIIGACRTVAVEWAPLHIRVNCIAPGLIATRGLDIYPPEAVKEFPLANPMRRPGTAMEIAEGCIYLTAPSGSFITGEVLTVDGGGVLWGELWTAGRPDWFDFSQD